MADHESRTHSQDNATSLVQNYHTIAQQLKISKDLAQTNAALEPIQNQPVEEQIAFIKAMGKENTVEAADVVQALHTLSPDKEVRKEARRRLIQLEGKDVYAEWTLPSTLTLTEALERAVDLEVDDSEDPFFASLKSFFEDAETLLKGPAYAAVVSDFLDAWGEGNYTVAATSLASQSSVRNHQSEADWAESREAWASQAQVNNFLLAFVHPAAEDDDANTSSPRIIEAAFSLVIQPGSATLPECPQPTLTFEGTGRSWFLLGFTVAQEGEQWLIQDISNTAAEILTLDDATIVEMIHEIDEQIAKESEEGTAAIIEEEPEIPNVVDADVDEPDDDDEDDDEDDEDEDEDDEDDEDLAGALGQMDTVIRLVTKQLHYYDALFAHDPKLYPEFYKEAFDLAGSIMDIERAALYAQQFVEHVPEERGSALRNLAFSYHALAAEYHNRDDHESEERFLSLVVPTIRQAVAADESVENQILLATILIQNEQDLDEAESYLIKAQRGPLSEDDQVDVLMGLAEIAMQRDDHEAALQHFQHLSHRSPEDEQVWYRIGYLQHRLHHYKEAIEALKHSIELQPLLTEAYTELASLYLVQDDVQQALSIAREGVDVNSDAPDMYATLALVYMSTNDFRSANRALTQAESLDEEDEFVHEVRQRYNAEMKQHRPSGNKPNQKQKQKQKQHKAKKR
ncbi:tetratricopeptide repeat protein [Dictyobacter arantiisoli]|uniref:Uncharacterized protein n=1 Tax=Dictyobacter arantiisoli TaxID=2014874 RepID=A0A5A5T9I9_9CHLR|nr:tetratricopeptide repeat protein [Dictyobacter arantiisoli]GCF07659.1 hypothetical protein KDI_12230 [Dictyobacter arantiisoli]